MVGPAGLEPATPDLEGRCSIRMSYEPIQLQFYGIRGLDSRESGVFAGGLCLNDL